MSFFFFFLLYNIVLVLPYINMNPPRVYTCSPTCTLFYLPPCTIPLGHPSAPALSILYPAWNLDWWFVSYMILYMFQCLTLECPCLQHSSPDIDKAVTSLGSDFWLNVISPEMHPLTTLYQVTLQSSHAIVLPCFIFLYSSHYCMPFTWCMHSFHEKRNFVTW